MNWKTTLALAVIVLIGGLYIHFVEQETETTSEALEKGKKVFSEEKDLSDHVSRLAVKRDDGEFHFERAGEAADASWKMTEPLKARADKSEIKSIASDLEDLKIKNAISAEGKNLKLEDYGLDKPKAEITFSVDKNEYKLLIGSASPTDEDEIFVRRAGSDRIYIVSKSIYGKANKSLNEYRDKKVIDVEKDKVLSLKLDWNDKTDLLTSRMGTEWVLNSPVDDFANKTKIEGFVDKIRDLKIDKEDFFLESMDDPARFGLGLPQLAATLLVEGKVKEEKKAKEEGAKEDESASRQELVILFGGPVEGKSGKIYAKRSDEPTVFGLSDSILKDLEISNLKDLRSTDFAVFEDDDVQKVEVKLASGLVAVEQAKKEEKPGDSKSFSSSDVAWKLTQPKERDADKTAVDNFIDSLDELKIEEFKNDDPNEKDLETFGLVTPAATVTIHLKEDKGSQAFDIGRADESNAEQFFARRSGRKNVFLIRKKDFQRNLLTGHLLFRKKQVIEFSKSDVQKLIVVQADKTVVVKKGKDEWTWQLTQPVTAPAENSNVDNILWGISSLEAARFVAESPQDLTPYGLDKPLLKVTVELEEEEKDEKKEDEDEEDKDKKAAAKKVQRTVSLLVGSKAPDEDGYYAKLEEGKDKDFVFVLPNSKYETLTKELHDREIIEITKSEVKGLTLQYREVTLACEKEEGKEEWKMTLPRKAEAKKTEIEDILDELDPLKGEKVVSYRAVEPGELAPFGLDHPEVTVKVNLKDGKEKTFLIGNMVKEGSEEFYYVKAAEKDAVHLVRKGIVTTINKSEKDLAKEEAASEKKEAETGAKEDRGTEEKKAEPAAQ